MTGDFAPLWSPEGNAIAFARVEEAAGDPDEAALYVHDLATGTERRLTRFDLEASSYAWWPDASKLAFGRSVGGSSVYSIRRDLISCGPGQDAVRADRVDVVAADCERVKRY